MQQKLKHKKIDEEIRKFKKVNVASPILTETDVEQNTPNVSDNESCDEEDSDTRQDAGGNSNIRAVSDWQNIVSRWLNMLEDSDLDEMEIDDDLEYDDEYDITVNNIFNLPHPATDRNAKWKLQDIFVERLGTPSYLTDFLNNN